MATDFSSKPKPPVLKRFANLDIDGVEKPERAPSTALTVVPPTLAETVRVEQRRPEPVRPNRTEPRRDADDPDLAGFHELTEELNANARMMRDAPPVPRTRFNMPMPGGPQAEYRAQRAAELRRTRPPDPPLASRGVGVDARLWELPRAPRVRRDGLDDFEGMTPGVVTVEVDLRRQGGMSQQRARPAPETLAPLELTPMAARQIQLMAWEAGVPGSGLRVLTCDVGGLGRPEIDFAFDDHPEPDDLVFMCHGVTIMIDPGSLRWVAGRRITWHDIPGSEGFGIL